MPCLSRALEWMRAVLSGLLPPDKRTSPAPQRQQHAKRLSHESWERAGAMVRPYVATLGEAPRYARTGAQADPWGDAG